MSTRKKTQHFTKFLNTVLLKGRSVFIVVLPLQLVVKIIFKQFFSFSQELEFNNSEELQITYQICKKSCK